MCVVANIVYYISWGFIVICSLSLFFCLVDGLLKRKSDISVSKCIRNILIFLVMVLFVSDYSYRWCNIGGVAWQKSGVELMRIV